MQARDTSMPAADRDFVRWVHRVALLLLVVFVPAAGRWGTRAVLGYALGGVLSILLLWSHQWLVARVFERGAPGLRRSLVAFWLVKYPILAAILYFAVARHAVNAIALCVGLGLVPLAMAIKILGGSRRGR
jgi:hypothetical protein